MFRLFNTRLPDTPYTKREIERIRANIAPLTGTPIAPFDEEAFRLFYKTGSRVEYEAIYFETRRRLCAYAALALWEDDRTWIAELERALSALLAEPTWALPAHVAGDADEKTRRETLDLFACESAEAIAEILSLLGERLDPALKEALHNALEERVARPYLTARRRWGKGNWSAVCAGCVAMVFMYEFPELLDDALPTLRRSLDDFLSSYNRDGCCLEGPLYWEYGFGFFTYAADMLRAFTGGKLDLFADPKVRAIASFGQDMFLDGRHVIPLADAPHTLAVHIGLMHRLNREYDLGGFPSDDACAFGRDVRFRFAPFIRDFYWYDPDADHAAAQRPPVSFYRESGWFIARRGGYTAVCKGGHNAEPHNHNDLGSFLLFADGAFPLDDPGWPEYTRDYFGPRRYEDYVCASSAGHSVPLVNGKPQSPGEDRRARLLTSAKNEIAYELSSAYGVENLALTRIIRFDDGGVTLIDRVKNAEAFVERFVTRLKPLPLENAVQIGAWRVTSAFPARVGVQTAQYAPRFRGFVTGESEDNEIETLYQIDFTPETANGEFRFRVERHD